MEDVHRTLDRYAELSVWEPRHNHQIGETEARQWNDWQVWFSHWLTQQIISRIVHKAPRGPLSKSHPPHLRLIITSFTINLSGKEDHIVQEALVKKINRDQLLSSVEAMCDSPAPRANFWKFSFLNTNETPMTKFNVSLWQPAWHRSC